MNDRKLFYSVQEVANILGYTKQGIYYLIQDGHIKSEFPPGQKTCQKIPRSELVRMLRRKAAGEKLRQYRRVVDTS